MSLRPLRCKICSSILQEPPIIIGEKPEERQGKTAFVILSHMQEMQTKEAQNGNGPKPHVAADFQISQAMRQAALYLTLGVFDLPDFMEAMRERLRAHMHAATAPAPAATTASTLPDSANPVL